MIVNVGGAQRVQGSGRGADENIGQNKYNKYAIIGESEQAAGLDLKLVQERHGRLLTLRFEFDLSIALRQQRGIGRRIDEQTKPVVGGLSCHTLAYEIVRGLVHDPVVDRVGVDGVVRQCVQHGAHGTQYWADGDRARYMRLGAKVWDEQRCDEAAELEEPGQNARDAARELEPLLDRGHHAVFVAHGERVYQHHDQAYEEGEAADILENRAVSTLTVRFQTGMLHEEMIILGGLDRLVRELNKVGRMRLVLMRHRHAHERFVHVGQQRRVRADFAQRKARVWISIPIHSVSSHQQSKQIYRKYY